MNPKYWRSSKFHAMKKPESHTPTIVCPSCKGKGCQRCFHSGRIICGQTTSADNDYQMAAEMRRKHDEPEDMERRLCNPEI